MKLVIITLIYQQVISLASKISQVIKVKGRLKSERFELKQIEKMVIKEENN